MVRAIAVVGFCQTDRTLHLRVPDGHHHRQRRPLPRGHARLLHRRQRACAAPALGIACPRPDLPIHASQRPGEISASPQLSHEQAMQRVQENYGKQ
jgi:hypothetical protein